jgi:cell division protease FtsH
MTYIKEVTMMNDPQQSPYSLDYDEKAELDFSSSSGHLLLEEAKNLRLIAVFLGEKVDRLTTTNFPLYYGALSAWALIHYLQAEGWDIVQTLSYQAQEPRYESFPVDYDKEENLPVDANLLIQKAEVHLMVGIEIAPGLRSLFNIAGNPQHLKLAQALAAGVKLYAHEHNFYRGKKIEFNYLPRFLKVQSIPWSRVIVDDEVKREIRTHTLDFLNRKEFWRQYGIPLKRGVLLAGEPGTGKTLILKALLSEAAGITCITCQVSGLYLGDSFMDIYSMAEDLRPSLIVIEDLDLIGKTRDLFITQESALVSLLKVMDGIEAKEEIVTVATTNYLEILDKALKERPSRFDRVISLTLPNLEQRRALVQLHCPPIPLAQETQHYISKRTEGFSPAQIQEVLFSLVIENPTSLQELDSTNLPVGTEVIDRLIARIRGRPQRHLGFTKAANDD